MTPPINLQSPREFINPTVMQQAYITAEIHQVDLKFNCDGTDPDTVFHESSAGSEVRTILNSSLF